jgi:uncharacterized protein (TIGR03067 family)
MAMSEREPMSLSPQAQGQSWSAESLGTPLVTPRQYGILIVDAEGCVRSVLNLGMRQRGLAVCLAADDATAGGFTSAQAAALAKGVLGAMFMARGKILAALVLALAVVMSGAAVLWRYTRGDAERQEREAKSDEETLEGDWEVVSFGPIEEVSSEEMKQKIMSLTWTFERGKHLVKEVSGDKTMPLPYKLDSTKTPKTIDLALTIDLPFGQGLVYHGIYKLEGDKLTMCYSRGPRPTEFEVEKGSQRALYVLKRKK